MPRHKRFNPRVVPRVNAKDEVTSWFVDCGMIDGRRIRFSFDTKARAQVKADQLKSAHREHGDSILNKATTSYPDAVAALELLAPHNATLLEAARFFIKNIHMVRDPRTVEEVMAELLQAKDQDSRSARYLKDLGQKLSAFADSYGDQSIHEITTPELNRWIRALGVSGVTRNGYKRALGVLFSYAVKMEYSLKNPARNIDKANEDVVKPGILSIAEAEALLRATEPDFVPAIAIGLFAGLRPEAELWRLDWRSVDLDNREIDVSISKNSVSHRFVKISDNLAAWLEPYAKKSGPVTLKGDSYYSRLQRARESAADKLEAEKVEAINLRLWPQDCMRQTFASCHYNAFKSAGDTAHQLGHGGSLRVFQRHYLNRVREPEAKAFWQILP